MISAPLGLLAWVGLGLLFGLASRFLPGGSRGCLSVVLAVLGAVAGGVFATAFDFGGLLELDPLSLVPAGLAAALPLLLLRLRESRRPNPKG